MHLIATVGGDSGGDGDDGGDDGDDGDDDGDGGDGGSLMVVVMVVVMTVMMVVYRIAIVIATGAHLKSSPPTLRGTEVHSGCRLISMNSASSTICPGQDPPLLAVKRPARPYKNAIERVYCAES
jgi:hypothetical protein